MKKALLSALLFCSFTSADAQITITAADMPVAGDTLRYSIANPATPGLDYTSTGAGFSWNFSTLTPIVQAVDTFKLAAQVNLAYGVTISPTAYGYKIGDSLPMAPPGVTVTELYNFFNKKASPARYVIEGFAAKLNGTPLPINYSDEDEVYLFPLTHTRTPDTTTFKLRFNNLIGSFSQQGTRRTYVDGYGTITTPYTSTAVQVLRVRSEIEEIDSVKFGTINQVIPRHTVEYKWLANGEHYPLLIITTNKFMGNESVSSVRYRDVKRQGVSVANINGTKGGLQVYPNPAQDVVNIKVPQGLKNYTVYLYDVCGKVLLREENATQIAASSLISGKYMITVEGDNYFEYAYFVK